MVSSKLCARKKCHKCLKFLLVVLVIGIYFVILLRESFAAWELTKAKNSNIEVSKYQQLRALPLIENKTKQSRTKSKLKLAFVLLRIWFSFLFHFFVPRKWQLQSRAPRKYHHHRKSINDLIRQHNRWEAGQPMNKSVVSTTVQPTTLNPVYEYSEEVNAAAEYDFSQRRSRLWDTCEKINFVGRYPPNAWEFFISPGHGIAWCNVFKAASSTWMYYFNILGE